MKVGSPPYDLEDEMSEWSHSICDDCWLIKCGEEGELRLPVRVKYEHRDEETCCFCGEKTMSGIYIRQDPAKMDCSHAPEQ